MPNIENTLIKILRSLEALHKCDCGGSNDISIILEGFININVQIEEILNLLDNIVVNESDPIFTAWLENYSPHNSILLDRTVWVNRDLTEDSPNERIFKNYNNAVTWINANGNLSNANQWTVRMGYYNSTITAYDNIIISANYIDKMISERTQAYFGDSISYIKILELNNANFYLRYCRINTINGSGIFRGSFCEIGFLDINTGTTIFARSSTLGHIVNNGGSLTVYNSVFLGLFTSNSGNIQLINTSLISNLIVNGGWVIVLNHNGNIELNNGNLITNSHQGIVTKNGGTWTNKGETINPASFTKNLDLTVDNTQKLAKRVDDLNLGITKIQLADDVDNTNFAVGKTLVVREVGGIIKHHYEGKGDILIRRSFFSPPFTSYRGFAPENSLETDSVWTVTKTVENANGTIFSNEQVFNHKWTEINTI